MVQVHARDERVQEGDRLEDVAPVARVLLEDLVLLLGELAGLVEVHDAADLADVVHERGLADDLDRLVVHPQLDGQDLRVGGDPLGVTGRVAVHLVDGARETADGLVEGGLQILVELRVLDGGGGSVRDHVEQLSLALVEALAPSVAHGAEKADRLLAGAQSFHDQRLRRERLRLAVEVLVGRLPVRAQRLPFLEVLQEGVRIEVEQLDLLVDHLAALVHALVEGAVAIVQQYDDSVGVHLEERRVDDGADDLFERQAVRDRFGHLVERERLFEAHVLGLQLLLLEAAPDGVDDLLHLEGLEDVVVGAALHRLDGGLDRAEAGHDHGDHVRRVFLDGAQQLDATHLRHLQVTQHQVVMLPRELDERLRAILRGSNDEAFHRKEVGQDLTNDLLVVDDQDVRGLFVRLR